MPSVRFIKFPSVSVWLLKEVDAKVGLDVQGIYWRKFLQRIKGEEVKYSGETSYLLQIWHLWKESRKSWWITRWYKPNLYTWGVWAHGSKTLFRLGLLHMCIHSYSRANEYWGMGVPKWITWVPHVFYLSPLYNSCPNSSCWLESIVPAERVIPLLVCHSLDTKVPWG